MISICKESECYGCSACMNTCPVDAITMKEDKNGFLRPVVNNNCIDCYKCKCVCPVLNKPEGTDKRFEKIAFAAFNSNEEIRLKSSSGGLFSAMASNVLKDNGAIAGATFTNDFKVVQHKLIENIDSLEMLYGSKYLQSDFSYILKPIAEKLLNGKKVLCVGTPCQIAALKLFLNEDYVNLFTVDIICHGVPSPKIWKKSLSEKSIKNVSFRDKTYGWKEYNTKIIFDDDSVYKEAFTKDSFMTFFLSNLCLRPSCYNCGYKIGNSTSDITIGDFWGIENILPSMDDDKGTSLAVINTEKGLKLWNEIKNILVYKKVNLESALSYNSAAYKSVHKPNNYDSFFKDADVLSFNELANKYKSKMTAKDIIKKTQAGKILLKVKHKFINRK